MTTPHDAALSVVQRSQDTAQHPATGRLVEAARRVLVEHSELDIEVHSPDRVAVTCPALSHGQPPILGFADAGDERRIVWLFADHQARMLAEAGLLGAPLTQS